jgi:hypothetical protein
MKAPIDWIWHKKINAYTSYPFVAFQSPCVSDNSGQYSNTKNIMKQYEERICNYVKK